MKRLIVIIAVLFMTSAQAGWQTSTSVDEMENRKTVFMTVKSEDHKGQIIIRQPENVKDVRDIDIYWIPGDPHICAMDDFPVKAKFDDGEVIEEKTMVSTDKTALFFRTIKRGPNPEYPKDWKTQQELLDEEIRLARAKDYKGALKVNAELIALMEKQQEHGIYEGVMMENGLKDKFLNSDQVYLRYHDSCGENITQKFLLKN